MDIHDDVVWLVSQLEQQRYVEAGIELRSAHAAV